MRGRPRKARQDLTERLQHEEDKGARAARLDVSREISARLSVAARKLRFSTSARSQLYRAVGLRTRLVDRLFVAGVAVVTVSTLLVPIVVSLIYFGYVASDQYESETRFTVRSSTPALGKDQIANVTGIPSAKIVQDTQIVVNFIKSREMLDVLSRRKVDLHSIYGKPSVDWWARLPGDATVEELLEYWEKMITTGVSASSGIVVVKVRSFSPGESAMLAQEILNASEVVVNQVNDRIWQDVTSTAQQNVGLAQTQLQVARKELADARNQNGVLTIEGSSQIISNLISTMEAERLALQQRYDAQLSAVSPNAPQMRVLRREIESKEHQITQLRSQVAGQNSPERNLADVSQDLSELQLAQSLAEQHFSSSVKTLEQVQFVSRQQLLYLDSFLPPRIPDEAMYPRRILWIALIFVLSLFSWGASLGMLHLTRNRLSN